MDRIWIKFLNYCITLLMAVVLTISLCVPALAEESQKRILRVAFPNVDGMSETTEDGKRYGLVVDYLNEISKYTGWEYEYIDTTGETMTDEFLAGEYDLMGGNYYFPGLEKYYAYPDYNTGYSRSVLLSRSDDYSIKSYNLESLNGKTIGVYERAIENIRRLKEFLSINDLKCNFRYFTYDDISEDGNLYAYLKNGEVDILLGNSTEFGEEFKVVASFDSQPYYIVTNVGNEEVLEGLNMALEKILDSNPNFGDDVYNANFKDKTSVDIQLNKDEIEYIKKKGTVTVAVPAELHPLFCPNDLDGPHPGVAPEILERISDFSGLEFSYVYKENYINALEAVQNGEADILAFYLGNEEESIKQGLALTSSYVTINSIVVRNKASSYPSENLVGAVLEGRQMPSDVSRKEVLSYPSITEALSAVNQGKADFVYGLSARLEQDIQRYHFSNLVPVTLVNDQSDISFALARPLEPDLLTVFNKAINSISIDERTAILNRNMVSIGTSDFSLAEIIYANPVTFVVIVAVILLLIVTVVLLTTRSRMRAAVMQSNLEKLEAESRAKGEFLSRMSHEIRTPMNAVVGLADLTSMMEGIPENVRDNLSKIRSSSNYLLSLINDILDMSRIDSGMLSIASEPMSMERMLGDLESMMAAEAERREIVFTLEKNIIHSDLIGDAIRLRQVLTNLLSNAFKFTPRDGTVTLSITEMSADEKEAVYTFSVIDSGIGIREEDQQRIFNSFEQIGPNSSKSQGTGLGLSISQSIVKLMGGELCLKSMPENGSEFYFTVALSIGSSQIEQESFSEKSSLAGIKILMAEDNDLNAEIAVQLLELQGAKVCRSENGRKVVEQFEESEPGEFKAILMDIQMPEMNGLDAARAIRSLKRPDAASIPIIAMTANSFQEDVDAAKEAGMNGFISKPLDVSYLYSLLADNIK